MQGSIWEAGLKALILRRSVLQDRVKSWCAQGYENSLVVLQTTDEIVDLGLCIEFVEEMLKEKEM